MENTFLLKPLPNGSDTLSAPPASKLADTLPSSVVSSFLNKPSDKSTYSTISDFADQVQILPSKEGNVINFNLTETTKINVSVSNILGQVITNPISAEATNQSLSIKLPEEFTGIYVIKIESAKGVITKKFIRK